MERQVLIQLEAQDSTAATDFELGVLLERARSVYARMRELEIARFGLTAEQAAILHVLQSKGGSATNDEIANTIIRQYHSVASIVSRMAKLGLVKKEKVKNRQKYIISITPKGASTYRKVSRNSIKMIFMDLSAADKAQMASFLRTVIAKGRGILGLDHVLPFLEENSSGSEPGR
jgi:DNA-binding MarR family transcriptional regulator